MKRVAVPLHDDEQALLAVVHVLVQAEDANDVRPRRHPPVELHLSPRFGAVIQNLEERWENELEINDRTREASKGITFAEAAKVGFIILLSLLFSFQFTSHV